MCIGRRPTLNENSTVKGIAFFKTRTQNHNCPGVGHSTAVLFNPTVLSVHHRHECLHPAHFVPLLDNLVQGSLDRVIHVLSYHSAYISPQLGAAFLHSSHSELIFFNALLSDMQRAHVLLSLPHSFQETRWRRRQCRSKIILVGNHDYQYVEGLLQEFVPSAKSVGIPISCGRPLAPGSDPRSTRYSTAATPREHACGGSSQGGDGGELPTVLQ